MCTNVNNTETNNMGNNLNNSKTSKMRTNVDNANTNNMHTNDVLSETSFQPVGNYVVCVRVGDIGRTSLADSDLPRPYSSVS